MARLPIEAPNAVLDTDEAFATCRIHERAELIDRPVVPRRELEHRLDAVYREPAEVREHALDELPTTGQVTRAPSTGTKAQITQDDAPSSTPSSAPPVVAAP